MIEHMKKFLVTYLAPVSVLEAWQKTDPEKRKAAEEKMQSDWKKWMADHADIFDDVGAGVGKTKVVTPNGVSARKNDIMLYSIVEAKSHDAAAKVFVDHPHFGIPEASIEVMEIHPLMEMRDK